MVSQHAGHVIVRLPQVVGVTPNPHTLVNYLRDRIVRGERFDVWRNARRNLIDADDVRAIVMALLESGVRSAIVNVANPLDYAVLDIVYALERAVGNGDVRSRRPRGRASHRRRRHPALDEPRGRWIRTRLSRAVDPEILRMIDDPASARVSVVVPVYRQRTDRPSARGEDQRRAESGAPATLLRARARVRRESGRQLAGHSEGGRANPRVRGVLLRRNAGQHNATMAGLHPRSRGAGSW